MPTKTRQKQLAKLQWVRFTRKIGEYDLDAEYAIEAGRKIHVRLKGGGMKTTQLGGSSSDPESLAAMLALELAKGL